MIFGAIVAGGLGKRMGVNAIPKQFLLLGNKPIIIHTIEKFLICNSFDYIVIGVHKDFNLYFKDLLKNFNIFDKKVLITNGGEDRNSTILNIIDKIEKDFSDKLSDYDIIVTHDAVRPFVSIRIIEENIACAKKFGACDTVVPSNDTIVKSDKNKELIMEIPKREFMFLGQTPQSFNLKKLKKFYNNLNDEEKNCLTDACKIFSLNNHPIKLILGEYSNIKITNANDMKIANYYI